MSGVKKNVFSAVLKLSKDGELRMEHGNRFHAAGPVTTNARPPNFVLVRWTTRSPRADDRVVVSSLFIRTLPRWRTCVLYLCTCVLYMCTVLVCRGLSQRMLVGQWRAPWSAGSCPNFTEVHLTADTFWYRRNEIHYLPSFWKKHGLLHCALAAAQCIVIGPVCACVFVGLLPW